MTYISYCNNEMTYISYCNNEMTYISYSNNVMTYISYCKAKKKNMCVYGHPTYPNFC